MCGIAGILHGGSVADAGARVRKMCEAMVHRGPDDLGLWDAGDVSFGFRRLAILDVAGGKQPLATADGSVRVIFNGEIYNHRQLRQELVAKGRKFLSDHSDTEVLVHGWSEWGADLLPRLNGMFAFAIWDDGRRELVLARDRFGIKPLYLARSGPSLLWASEVEPLFASGLVPRKRREEGVLEYFMFQNNWHGRTPFEGIEMFPAGSYARIKDPASWRPERFWTASFDRRFRGSFEDAVTEHRRILEAAVVSEIEADVPIVTYLSGGIDSTAVSTVAVRQGRVAKAYSCIFDLDHVGDDRLSDERDFSRLAARYLQIPRIEHEIPAKALEQTLSHTIRALEYPRMGMSYANDIIAGVVARDAKVVMSGMGGDELHGGYIGRYQITSRPASGFLSRLKERFQPPKDHLAVYRQVLNSVIPAAEMSEAFEEEFLKRSSGFDPRAEIERTVAMAPSDDPWDVVMYTDLTTYMAGLLVLEDKLSMRHSLETRVPLLDNDLADFVSTLPWEYLCSADTGKLVFREAVRPWLPREISEKPKMGFGPPDASWYRRQLRPWIEERLSPQRIAALGCLKYPYVRRILDEHFSGARNRAQMIWTFLSFAEWNSQQGFSQ